jgi:GntR family transcriptional regulator
MLFNIDSSNSIPVYAQIVEQIKRAVACGILKPGDSLPSLRETALRLRVNPITVAKAYKELEHAGVVTTRQGLGSFVNDSPDANDLYKNDALTKSIDDLLVDAMHLGVDFDSLKKLVSERMEALGGKFAGEIEDNRDGKDSE